MFLSRLTFDTSTRDARRDLSNPYAMHQSLAWALPNAGQDVTLSGSQRILWRLDAPNFVLVQTAGEPDWPAFIAHHPQHLCDHKVKQFNPGAVLQENAVFHFRLQANPTVRKIGDDGKSRRLGLSFADEQLKWLARQGELNGFTPQDVQSSQSRREQAFKPKSRSPLTVQVVTFEGQLVVTDPQAFTRVVENGLGHARALGCGLISLATN